MLMSHSCFLYYCHWLLWVIIKISVKRFLFGKCECMLFVSIYVAFAYFTHKSIFHFPGDFLFVRIFFGFCFLVSYVIYLYRIQSVRLGSWVFTVAVSFDGSPVLQDLQLQIIDFPFSRFIHLHIVLNELCFILCTSYKHVQNAAGSFVSFSDT